MRGNGGASRPAGYRRWLAAAVVIGLAGLAWWGLAPPPVAEEATAEEPAVPAAGDEEGAPPSENAGAGEADHDPSALRLPAGRLPGLPDEPAPKDAPAMTVERYFELLLDAECACTAGQRGVEAEAADLVSCRALMRTIGPSADADKRLGVAAGRVSFDPIAAERCLQEFQACAQRDGDHDRDVASACDAVFRGRVAIGGRCADDVDCAEGSCSKATHEDHATCRLPSAKGGPCGSYGDCLGSDDDPLHCIDGSCQPPPSDEGAHCELDCASPGLWCDVRATPAVCRARVPRDGACDPDRDACAPSLACLDTAEGPRCRPRGALGEPCDVSVHPLVACSGELVCVADAAGGRCRRRLELGAACEGDVQCPYPEAYCARLTTTGPGRCTTMPVDGEPCVDREVRGWRCRVPFVCNFARGRCVESLGDGAACDGHNCGALNRVMSCVAGVCRPRLPEGAPCEPEPEDDDGPSVARCAWGLGCVGGRCRKP